MSKRVYAEQARIAATYLKSGHAVIADAVFDRAADRQRIEAVVPQTIPFNGFWLDAPLELLIDRVSHRVGDPSDATPSVLRQQVNSATQTEWQSLSAGETVASTAAMLIQRVRAAPDMAER